MRVLNPILLFLVCINSSVFAGKQPFDLLHKGKIEYKILHKSNWKGYSNLDFDILSKGDTLLLKVVLPDIEFDEPAIFLSSYFPGFDILFNDRLIYPYFPKENYYNQHIIKLTENYKNQILIIQIPLHKRVNKGTLYSLQIGDYHELNTQLLTEIKSQQKRNIILSGIIAIILFTSALSLFIFFLRFKNREYQFLFYALTTISAVTENIDMSIFESLIKFSPTPISDIEVVSRYSIIIFSLLFIKYAFKPNEKAVRFMLVFFISFSIIALCLYFSGSFLSFYSILGQLYSILTVITLGVFVVLIRKTESYKHLRYKNLFLLFVFTFVLVVTYTSFTIFYFEHHREAPLLYGILAISFAMLTILISNYIDSLEKNINYRLKLEVQNSEILKLQQANMEVQYEALKSQVNPHFLFNCLNALSALVYPSPQPLKAKQFIDEFSKIFRYVLDVRSKNVITLENELEFVKSYLFLQRIRFSDGLKIIEDIDTDLLKYMLPPLSLQIIIENAIKHNIILKEKPLIIEIFTGDNKLIVKNNLQRRYQKENESSKIGQKNISDRYALLSDELPSFIEENNVYFSIIPLLKDEQD